MKKRKSSIYVCDFETTKYDGQARTDVWAAACVKMDSEDVKIFHSIDEQFDFFVGMNENLICYYHNLKFDGSFWLSFLLKEKGFKNAVSENNGVVEWDRIKDMANNTLCYLITDMGLWYSITVKVKNKIIEFRDSLKLLPFSVKEIGKGFKTKHQKLDMEYEGFRFPGCTITDAEKEYIANDVLVVKEALEVMFSEGHNKLTIGACALSEYRQIIGNTTYKNRFPDVYEIALDPMHEYETAGDWIRQSYRGGWCYLVRGKENRVFNNGCTADVNSLYPSMMHSSSGNKYPIGSPTFWHGNFIPDVCYLPHKYFFVRLSTRFRIKKNHLPFVQVKNTMLYRSNEMLETSDIYSKSDGKYHTCYRGFDNQIKPAKITLTLTMTDYKLLLEQYDLYDTEILDGCYFNATIGIFDKYIEKYKKIKMENTGAKRTIAKLFLNNLYGKFSSGKDSSFKIAEIDPETNQVVYTTVREANRKPVYIPVGSAITSYARAFTIRAAQKNYYGADKRGFIYADTDSIHCDIPAGELVGIREDEKEFSCWKIETCWDDAIFVRQKTYVEHVTHENKKPVDDPYFNVTCAGMPEKSKILLCASFNQSVPDGLKLSEKEIEFISKKREITDFKLGLRVPGNLKAKSIEGGTILVDDDYTMR